MYLSEVIKQLTLIMNKVKEDPLVEIIIKCSDDELGYFPATHNNYVDSIRGQSVIK